MIIPVIDLLDGQVVHAIKGERHLYQPVKSTLCSSADPDAVIAAYFKLYPFRRIYIADLNAIQGSGNHDKWLQAVMNRHPETEFWVDAGMHRDVAATNLAPVIGSENNITGKQLQELCKQNSNAVLSLDFDTQGKLMNPGIMELQEEWPDRIIVMMLSRVGTGQGIDTSAVDLVKKKAGKQEVYVGGGVATIDEIKKLLARGITGVLLASALHNGSIPASEIELVMSV